VRSEEQQGSEVGGAVDDLGLAGHEQQCGQSQETAADDGVDPAG
jgi:hypothetical protein